MPFFVLYLLSPSLAFHFFPSPVYTSLTLPLLITSAPLPSFRKYNIRVEDIMVRDVRYITLISCYRDLQEMLLTGQLKTLALVESSGK